MTVAIVVLASGFPSRLGCRGGHLARSEPFMRAPSARSGALGVTARTREWTAVLISRSGSVGARSSDDRAVRPDTRYGVFDGTASVTALTRCWLVACALSLGCSKLDDPTRPPDEVNAVRSTGGSGALPTVANREALSSERSPTTVRPLEILPPCTETTGQSLKLKGLDQNQVQQRFGLPADRESYRAIERGGEFYGAIEHAYPSRDPDNRDVPIEEWTYKSKDCFLTIWFHRPEGTWETLDDYFWHKDTAF